MEIGRLIKCNGKKLVTAVGGDSIYCKMYDGFRSAYNGFSKTFFPDSIPVHLLLF
jgi:hypothetical protein